MIIFICVLFQVFAISFTQPFENKMDRYIVACHTTDFVCFKRQYQLLRDNVLLGNMRMGIPLYEPYTFRYSDTGTCVKVTGVEESELVAISYDGSNKKFSISLAMPVRLQQVDYKNGSRGPTKNCDQPDKEFEAVGRHRGPLKKFSGNATIEVSYPLRLHNKKGDVYMLLQDEDLDVVLDVPDLSQHDKDSELERKLFEWSEWAYDMVQHVDVAEHAIAPFTDQVKRLFGFLPLERFILLYPSEEYSDLKFSYANDGTIPTRM